MNVIRAKTAGFCMGVSLALQKLDTALDEATTGIDKSNDPRGRICTLGPIIHNPQVLAFYEAKGVACVRDAAELLPDDRVIIRAHGIIFPLLYILDQSSFQQYPILKQQIVLLTR